MFTIYVVSTGAGYDQLKKIYHVLISTSMSKLLIDWLKINHSDCPVMCLTSNGKYFMHNQDGSILMMSDNELSLLWTILHQTNFATTKVNLYQM